MPAVTRTFEHRHDGRQPQAGEEKKRDRERKRERQRETKRTETERERIITIIINRTERQKMAGQE
jgi:hypothetical protein